MFTPSIKFEPFTKTTIQNVVNTNDINLYWSISFIGSILTSRIIILEKYKKIIIIDIWRIKRKTGKKFFILSDENPIKKNIPKNINS